MDFKAVRERLDSSCVSDAWGGVPPLAGGIRALAFYRDSLRQLPANERLNLDRVPEQFREIIAKVATRYGDDELRVSDACAFINELIEASGDTDGRQRDMQLTRDEVTAKFGSDFFEGEKAAESAQVLAEVAHTLAPPSERSGGISRSFYPTALGDELGQLLDQGTKAATERFGSSKNGALTLVRLADEDQERVAHLLKDASHAEIVALANTLDEISPTERRKLIPEARRLLIEALLDGATGIKSEQAILSLLTNGGAGQVLAAMDNQAIKALWDDINGFTVEQFAEWAGRQLDPLKDMIGPYEEPEASQLADILRQVSTSDEAFAARLDDIFPDGVPWS